MGWVTAEIVAIGLTAAIAFIILLILIVSIQGICFQLLLLAVRLCFFLRLGL